MTAPGPQVISAELHDQAAEAWTAARERVKAARAELAAAQQAEEDANAALTAQEACPGIPAWFHVHQVTAANCRLQYCSVHPDSDRYAGEF